MTANFGGIDPVRVLPSHDNIDAIYYTDQETVLRADPIALSSWSQVVTPNYPRDDFGPRLRARYFKLQIHRLEEVRGRRWLVWADSSLAFVETDFILEQVHRLSRLPSHQRLLLIPHPDRKTVVEEYEFIRDQIAAGNQYLRVRYEGEKMAEQMEYFRRQAWQTSAQLWCGTFWIVENSDLMNRVWDSWWDQNLRFGLMDQLSLPPLLDHYHCDPQPLDVLLWKNEHFSKGQHDRTM